MISSFDPAYPSCQLVTLENDHIQLAVLNHGARLVNCVVKDNDTDVLLGFENVYPYIEGGRYLGATVGRFANRIDRGVFTLNGKTYHVNKGNSFHALHGGPNGFDLKIFDIIDADDTHVTFQCESADGEEGFPGNLTLKVTYTLLDDGYRITTEATSDADTVCSITNHAFFNFDGPTSQSVENQLVQIEADYFSPGGEHHLALAEHRSVEGTAYDLRTLSPMNFSEEDEEIKKAGGYDNNYIIRGEGMRLAAKAEGTKVKMQFYTDYPCMQFYTGNFLSNQLPGKCGNTYPARSGMCFEPQYYPNAMNYPDEVQPILHANDVQIHHMEFHFQPK